MSIRHVVLFLFVLLSVAASPATDSFSEDWTGASPSSPMPFLSHPTGINWDITSHARNGKDGAPWGNQRNYDTLQLAWDAHHTDTCGAPPGVHTIQAYEDTVYICREHMMTSTYGPGAAQVVLTPNHLLDVSDGDATVRFDISTLRTAGRDYWQVNLTPLDDHQQLVRGAIVADLNGFPRNSIMINLKLINTTFGDSRAPGQIDASQITEAFEQVTLQTVPNIDYDDFLEPDAARRDTFEIKLTDDRTRLSVCMPTHEICFIDTELPQPFPDETAVVQFSHHSYNPNKLCDGSELCAPNTHHWDNFYMEPTVPFDIIKSDQRSFQVADSDIVTATFSTPAPAYSRLRFAALAEANSLEVSYDNGASWQAADPQPMDTYDAGAFWPYFTGDSANNGYVPEGISSVQIRGDGNYIGDFIVVRDISLWAVDPSTVPTHVNLSTQDSGPASSLTLMYFGGILLLCTLFARWALRNARTAIS